MNAVRAWLSQLPFQDAVARRHAAALQVLLLGILGGSGVALGLPFLTRAPDTARLVIFSLMCTAAAGSAVALWRLRLGHLVQAVTVASLMLVLVIESFLFFGGFAPHPSVLVGSAFPLLVASLGGNRRLMILVALVQALAMSVVAWMQEAHPQLLLANPEVPMVSQLVSIWIILGLLGLGMDRMGRVMEASVAEMRTQLHIRQRAEEELRRSQDLLRLVMDSMQDPVVLLDAQGEPIFTNPAFRHAAGQDNPTAQNLANVLDAADNAAARAALERVRTQPGTAVSVSMAVRDRDTNAPRRFDVTMLQARLVDAPVFLCVARDVTEHDQLQQQLVHAQKMDGIGRLAGGVAHDFNNLLLALGGHAALALESLDPAHPVTQDLLEIQKAAARATELTRQLLMFSRRQPAQPTRLDPAVLLRDTTMLLRRILGESIRLSVEAPPDAWPVEMDATQLSQVVMNLVVNARDAMPRGGQLRVRLSNVEEPPPAVRAAPEAPHGPCVCLCVEDEGTGMDDATRARMFEPFFTTKPAGQGTGLGLAVCYGIVSGAGGHIHVESAVGRGTTVAVYLPRAVQDAPHAAPTRAPVAAPGGRETVVLVEDEEAVRQLLQRVLTQAGYQVHAFGGGEDALALLDAQPQLPVDALITDMVMPGMQGDEVASQVMRRHPRAKVLLMSGYSQSTLLQGPLPDGLYFLAKPFAPAVLLRQLRSMLDGTTAPGAQA